MRFYSSRICVLTKKVEKFALSSGVYVLARLAQEFDTCKALPGTGPIESKLGAVLVPADGVLVLLANSVLTS